MRVARPASSGASLAAAVARKRQGREVGAQNGVVFVTVGASDKTVHISIHMCLTGGGGEIICGQADIPSSIRTA